MARKRRIRWNLQTIAGFVAILLGLVIVGAALYEVFGNRQEDSVYQSATIEADNAARTGTIQPIDPGGSKVGKLRTDDGAPARSSVFANEYGARGTHEVTVSVSGGRVGYDAQWRDGKQKARGTTTGTWSRTRTLKGGFPLAQVTIQGIASARASCTITVDGIEKSSEAITKAWGVTWCIG
ncbi:MAG TPA: hypothetical protein VK948_07035 [Aeromicrobium sp.]|nr:hypothetical protein [Aeromicrobium sp.]